MDKKRLKQLNDILIALGKCVSDLESLKDVEDDVLDSTPEALRETERYERSQAFSDNMGDALSELNSAVDRLSENL